MEKKKQTCTVHVKPTNTLLHVAINVIHSKTNFFEHPPPPPKKKKYYTHVHKMNISIVGQSDHYFKRNSTTGLTFA